ncbi:MAG: hypothetical protein P8X63_14705 [Desulfuromonadaceae bacterium]
MKRYNLLLALFMTTCFMTGYAQAGPDYFLGDAAVYSGSEVNPENRPNIMFLIDNSGAMKDMGSVDPYDPNIEYGGDDPPYPREQVYLRNVSNENITNYQTVNFTVDEIVCADITDEEDGDYTDTFVDTYDGLSYQDDNPDGNGYDDDTGLIHPRFALEQNGFWYGALNNKGECPNNNNQWENYFTGNFRNYLELAEPVEWTEQTAYEVDDMVKSPDGTGMMLKCVVAGYSGLAGNFVWPTAAGDDFSETLPNPDDPADDIPAGETPVQWKIMQTVLEMVQNEMTSIFASLDAADAGLMTFGDNNHGGQIIEPVLSLYEEDPNVAANLLALQAGLLELDDLVNGNTQPVNESLWDAYLYWRGEADDPAGIASDNVAYPSPINYWCQGNHLIVLTTGSAGNNAQTQTKVGDLDGDGNLGLVDDVAKMMYDKLLDRDKDGTIDSTIADVLPEGARVQTHIIQLMTPYVQRLERATDDEHGHGEYYQVRNSAQLIEALMDILTGILEADSSFVAPVVPASPENRSYSGDRIYLGFFKPMLDEPWYGNLKKFGLDPSYNIMGFNASGTEIAARRPVGGFLLERK